MWTRAALTFRISQGAAPSVRWTDKFAINEETQRTGMMLQPGLMKKKGNRRRISSRAESPTLAHRFSFRVCSLSFENPELPAEPKLHPTTKVHFILADGYTVIGFCENCRFMKVLELKPKKSCFTFIKPCLYEYRGG